MSRWTASDFGTSRLFIALGVATSFVIGSLSYAAGSTPEWVVLKASVGLLVVGVIGRLVSAVLSVGTGENSADDDVGVDKGASVDFELPEAVPSDLIMDK